MKKEDFDKKLKQSGLTQKEYDEICEFEQAMIEDIVNLVSRLTLSLNETHGGQFAATTVTAACLQSCALCLLPFMQGMENPQTFIDRTSAYFKKLLRERYDSFKEYKDSEV